MFKIPDAPITIAEAYPDLSVEEQAEAKENLVQYLGVVRRIFERVSEQDPKSLTEFEGRANLRERKDPA